MAGTIVVGLDGSASSAAALRWAVEEAARTGRSVLAVMAWSYSPSFDVTGSPTAHSQEEAGSRRELDELVAEHTAEFPDVCVEQRLVEGDPADALLMAAEGASLLTLGSHGRGRLLTALVGSVSAACLHRATCPVLIIPVHCAEKIGAAAGDAAAHGGTRS